ncbi:MAG: hypothetical protein M1816_000338 [Peltula sp. TS41687]|nr:MAG: hypothetical protein M1816_000338 [Peltula sp. TS41687]
MAESKDLFEQLKEARLDAERERQLRRDAERRTREAEEERDQAEERRDQAEERRDQAEERRDQAEERRDQAEERREQLERRTRATTLAEYLVACHPLSSSIQVQTDRTMTTKGKIPDPVEKVRPTWLRPWANFLDEQNRIWEMLRDNYPSFDNGPRVFDSLQYLDEESRKQGARKLASEADLAIFLRATNETPVGSILSHLATIPQVRTKFGLGNGLFFENHPNTLSDADQEVIQKTRRLPPDQIGVYTDEEQSSAAFVIEYKPPHKLTLQHLRMALATEIELKPIVEAVCVPSKEDLEKSLEFHARRVVAAVVGQTFAYMVDYGLEYSYITTGEAFVFLRVPLDDPGVVEFHLSEPKVEVGPDVMQFLPSTAVGQVLGFSLLSIPTPPRSQQWREDVKNKLPSWKVDYRKVLAGIPETVRKQQPPPSAFKPTRYTHRIRSPYKLRPKNKRKLSRRYCNSPVTPGVSSGSSDTSQSGPDDSPTPCRPALQTPYSRTEGVSQGQLSSHQQHGQQQQQEHRSHPYCTQECLRGLMHQTALDQHCPNFSLHRQAGGNQGRHDLGQETFLSALQEQLRQDRDHNCWPLRKEGARGALFKLRLASHGYTVAAKATVSAFVDDLAHEATVYSRLMPLQGHTVPVCLGIVDLIRPYYYNVGIQLVRMLILSWAGENLVEAPITIRDDREAFVEKASGCIDAIHRAGVLHRDVRPYNMLWNEERAGIMLIDFERSTLSDAIRPPLALSSANPLYSAKRKRKRPMDEESSPGMEKGTTGLPINPMLTLRRRGEIESARTAAAEAWDKTRSTVDVA